jgi:negative regulator of flagellin synthesis FlgM
MSIEINGSSNRPPVSTGEAKQSGAAGQDGSTASRGSSATGRSGADTFSMTNKAAQLQHLETQIANLPVVNTQRVTEVQHALATNTMEINPAQVADKMLTFEAGLGPEPAEQGNSQ